MSSFKPNNSSSGKYGFKNRGRLEITAEILAYCMIERTKTQIVLKCNMNTAQAHRYFDSLLRSRLLRVFRYNEKSEILKTTEKGKNFLSIYSRFNDIPCIRSLREQYS